MTRDNPGERHHTDADRRVEASGGAVFELPARAEPATQAAPASASERIKMQRRGEPEFVLREGVFFLASGIQVTAADLPDWVRNSVIAAVMSIRRVEYTDAKMRVKDKEA